MLIFCDFIQVYVFTRNHHLNDTFDLNRFIINISFKLIMPLI